MSNDGYDEFIEKEAKEILNSLKGSYLYFHPINMEDINSLVVAAYWTGYSKAHDAHMRDMSIRSMFQEAKK